MRYLFLILLNLPIILLALFNIVTQYKLKKVSRERFIHQIALWSVLLLVLIASFPVYNLIAGHPLLDSRELSLFDIAQTTAIVAMLYILNRQRQRAETNERMIRDLHQELSIKLSEDHGKN